MTELGYVYILSIDGMPGTLKIGCSMYGGRMRARDIRYDDIEGRFKSEFEIYCLHYRILEQDIHKMLNKYNRPPGRELFDISLPDAIKALIGLYMKKYMPKRPWNRKPKDAPIIEPEAYNLANWMCSKVLEVAPKTKTPNINKWADTIRLMVDVDGHMYLEIMDVFTWANNDSFWRTNILSPGKLRNQFSVLHAKQVASNENNQRPNQAGRPTGVDRVREAAFGYLARKEAESEGHGETMGSDAGDLREQVLPTVRGGAERELGTTIDGDYTRTDS